MPKLIAMSHSLSAFSHPAAARAWRRGCFPLLALVTLSTGCAALTNPVADGIPVSRVPPHLLAESRSDQSEIPPSLFRRRKDPVYRLAAGDVLAIYIEGILGDVAALPPVRTGDQEDETPTVGFPVPVRENGTLSLPQVPPVNVQGMSLPEAENAIRKAYTVTKSVVKPDQFNIILSLFKKRRYQILVIRQDTGNTTSVSNNSIFGTSSVSASSKRGTGQVIYLAEGENDVMSALAKTGGLPGFEAVNEVLVDRSRSRSLLGATDFSGAGSSYKPPKESPKGGLAEHYVRLPLRLRPGEPLPFAEKDIVLHDGDIVYIGSREADVFYTAGLIGAGVYPLPRDTDLDVIQALASVRAPLVNGAFGGNNLSGSVISTGLGFPNPSRLTVIRKTADNNEFRIKVDLNSAFRNKHERILVQTGDILVLQQTPGEAVANYLTQVIRFGYIGNLITAPDFNASVAGSLP